MTYLSVDGRQPVLTAAAAARSDVSTVTSRLRLTVGQSVSLVPSYDTPC